MTTQKSQYAQWGLLSGTCIGLQPKLLIKQLSLYWCGAAVLKLFAPGPSY